MKNLKLEVSNGPDNRSRIGYVKNLDNTFFAQLLYALAKPLGLAGIGAYDPGKKFGSKMRKRYKRRWCALTQYIPYAKRTRTDQTNNVPRNSFIDGFAFLTARPFWLAK